jgi:hypothetical protein
MVQTPTICPVRVEKSQPIVLIHHKNRQSSASEINIARIYLDNLTMESSHKVIAPNPYELNQV